MNSLIRIVHGGDARDRVLAESIAGKLTGLPEIPELMTADELIAWDRQREKLPGIARSAWVLPANIIFLLSESMVATADRRAAMVRATAGTVMLQFRDYFVCVGVAPQDLQDRYPDLGPIYENVMLRSESELPEVIEDFRNHFTAAIPGIWGNAGTGCLMMFSALLGIIAAQIGKIYSVRLLLMAGLALLLYFQNSGWLTITVMTACVYLAGFGLSRILPLDLWPWLGTRWKWTRSLDLPRLSQGALLTYGPVTYAGVIAALTAWKLSSVQHLPWTIFFSALCLQWIIDVVCTFRVARRILRIKSRFPTDLAPDATACKPEVLQGAMVSCHTIRGANLLFSFYSLILVAILVAVGAPRFPWSYSALWIAAFGAGIWTPTLVALVWLGGERASKRVEGLTRKGLSRHPKVFQPPHRPKMPWAFGLQEPNAARFSEEEQTQLLDFAFLHRLGLGHSLRGWFRRRDFAFVSYVWSDEKLDKAATALDTRLRENGTETFRDTRAIRDPFAAWRDQIAYALSDCTHFFLVVTPGIIHGQVVLREIDTVIRRWYLEMAPAVICVVDPDVARDLCANPQVPLLVRFLLASSPQMTPSEAANPDLLKYLVEYTRRQGKWGDWLTMLSARASKHRILKMPGLLAPASAPDAEAAAGSAP